MRIRYDSAAQECGLMFLFDSIRTTLLLIGEEEGGVLASELLVDLAQGVDLVSVELVLEVPAWMSAVRLDLPRKGTKGTERKEI